jgi:DNA-binding Lrp family transcriptional regulator
MHMTLDDIDRQLLELLQEDCTPTHEALGQRVGLSGSAVRRRIQAMRESGIIVREVAIVRDDVVAGGLMVIVSVAFGEETPDAVEAFRLAMRDDPRVLQCHAVSGPMDFVLLVVATSPADHEAWGERMLTANPAVRRSDSQVVWSTVKSTTRRAIRRLG